MTKCSLKQKILFASLFALTLSACQYEGDFINEIEENPVIEQLQGIQRDIMMNIALNRTGNVNQTSPKSRSIDVRLTPHILDGDTVLYIAQYADGWEIYSGSKLTNMVLFSSEHGIFDFNDELPESLRFMIEANANDIKSLPHETSPEQVHSSWGSASITENDLRNGHITVKVKSRSEQRRAISYSDLPPGHWEWHSTEKIDEVINTSSKLIRTEWNQDSPWNSYSKKVMVNNVLTPTKAGCVPIAIGQYFYYTHFKDNCPINTVTTATPTSDNTDFTFFGASSTLWDEMPVKNYYFDNIGAVAMLIGDIGRKLNADYGIRNTSVETYRIAPYLQENYNVAFPLEDFDYGYICQSINAGYPVITHAWSNIINDEKTDVVLGHTFLVDQYMTTTQTMKYTYVYKRDPLPSGVEDIWENDEIDENGNVITWAYTNEFVRDVDLQRISMNWGENSLFNSTFYSPYDSWKLAEYTYNLEHKMNKRQL